MKPILCLLLNKNSFVNFASYGLLAYKQIWSMSSCWLNRLNNEFVFSDLEPPTVNILYEWSGILDYALSCFLL